MLFTVHYAYGQDAAWSLEDCISYALENNIIIKQTELNSQYNENILSQSKVNRLPNLNASSSYDISFGRSLDYTTYEYIENFPLTVAKNDQRREPYDRQKLLQGILSACKKRPISMKKIESIVDKIEDAIDKLSKSEINSLEIGKMVMDQLHKLDDVAYVRFASVYRKFKDPDDFVSEVKGLDSKIGHRS